MQPCLFAVGGFAEAAVAVAIVVVPLCFVAAAAIEEADWQFVVVSVPEEGHPLEQWDEAGPGDQGPGW